MRFNILSLALAGVLVAACDTTPTDTAEAVGEGAAKAEEATVSALEHNFQETAGDRVFFDLNKSAVRADGKETLTRQADWLNKHGSVNASVEGHCDERGTGEYNMALGARRAEAAKKALVANGVSENRVEVISFGKERPAVVGSNEEAYAQNRRAVTVIKNAQ